MPRSRVLSFMSQWGGPRSPTQTDPPNSESKENRPSSGTLKKQPPPIDTTTPQGSSTKLDQLAKSSPTTANTPSRARADSRAASGGRPLSMVQSYNPPQVEVANDTPPELMPIFTFLNSHSNKLYQEGYFLKLHDLDSRGRPSPDRVWLECFAQLVGTVLSLWDAAALDAAGEDGEVVPTFINLSDASIKMIESLPMNGAAGGNLQNVLSISTAANNRYLLHFNSLSSLTQWTAGIRLAMYEHATLQEAYTGSLIAGKGKYLNNIKAIMERSKFQHDDWTRVRFGAGTPWKRCWCVVSPPDEKAFAKAQKDMKKSSAYERVKMPKGDIKFYDTRKVTKKTRPIATISDAYAAYAIYPQSKPLIDQSTLVKLEGLVTVHDSQEQTSEGFVFVMPEVHAAVSGFEMMLRWLFPVWDTFALYGRPTRLIADTLDQRGLMFAMPQDRRYGYLDILDVSGMIHTKGSPDWTERQWRRELKKMTSERMNNRMDGSPHRNASSRRATTTSRPSLPGTQGGVRFGDDHYAQSQPGSRSASPPPMDQDGRNAVVPPKRTDSAPPTASHMSPHKRSVSEAQGYRKYMTDTPSRLSEEQSREDAPPPPPKHGGALANAQRQDRVGRSHGPGSLSRIESESTVPTIQTTQAEMQMQNESPHLSPPQPVGSPPAFTHQPNSHPAKRPSVAPELRRAHSNVDVETLYQMQDAVRRDRTPDEADDQGQWNGEVQQRQQNTVASHSATRNLGLPADRAQGVVNRHDRDPRQRLSTIPGSPYIGEDAENFAAVNAAPVTQMRSVREERRVSAERAPEEERMYTPPIALHSQKSLVRKPVPKREPDTSETHATPPVPSDRTYTNMSTASSSSIADSWEGGYIDDEALERVLGGSRSNTMQTAESSEPDYASTVSASTKGKKSTERPRVGKLKTVGDPGMPTIDPRSGGAGKLDTWVKEQESANAEIPDVDFGRTLQYKPSSRPGTSGTLMPADDSDKRRSKSADALRSRSRDRLSGAFTTPKPSPGESNRNSYFGGGRNTPSPGRGLTPDPAGRLTPDVMGHLSPAGSPGAVNTGRRSVTPEEWVAQRASIAQQTQYAPPRKPVSNLAHMRSESTNSVKQRKRLTKTPPLGRTLSGDWTNFGGRETPPPRPSSRGAGLNLELANASLTAREQMQVSRATGTPLVDLAKNKKVKPKEEDFGLVGAVAARERDKASSRSNRNSVAVQQAIVERQQMQMRADAEAAAQAQQHAQYQAQVQAAHQQQMALMQQQQERMYYVQNQGAHYQNQQQGQGYPPYGQQQQRPGLQTQGSQSQQRGSWYSGPQQMQQGSFQQAAQGYYAQSPAAYSPGGGPAQGQGYGQGQQGHGGGYPQQAYGASFFAQQAAQQAQQGQGQGENQRRSSWRTWR